MLVSDAVRDCKTSKESIRKYRDFISGLSHRAQSSIAAHGAANPVLLSESSVSDQPASEVRPCSALRCCFCRYPPLKVRLRIRVLVSCSRLRLSACVSFLAHGRSKRLTSLFSCPSSPLIGLCYTSPTSRCCIVRLSSSVKVSTASTISQPCMCIGMCLPLLALPPVPVLCDALAHLSTPLSVPRPLSSLPPPPSLAHCCRCRHRPLRQQPLSSARRRTTLLPRHPPHHPPSADMSTVYRAVCAALPDSWRRADLTNPPAWRKAIPEEECTECIIAPVHCVVCFETILLLGQPAPPRRLAARGSSTWWHCSVCTGFNLCSEACFQDWSLDHGVRKHLIYLEHLPPALPPFLAKPKSGSGRVQP